MNAQRIRLIIGLMTLALIGIIYLQVYWIGWNIRLNEEQFDKNVYAALNRVGDKLQNFETVSVLELMNKSRGISNTPRGSQMPENGFAAQDYTL